MPGQMRADWVAGWRGIRNLDARDRSSRLLGHLRAIEKTIKTLAAAR